MAGAALRIALDRVLSEPIDGVKSLIEVASKSQCEGVGGKLFKATEIVAYLLSVSTIESVMDIL